MLKCRLSRHMHPVNRSKGLTLVEMMVAVAMSMVVVAAMGMLMANTLNSATRGIQMSRLTQEMRVAMQMMSRDVRRAGYNAHAIKCFGNPDCGTTGAPLDGMIAADIAINDANDCFYYQLDRDADGDSRDNAFGGFRRVTIGGSGVIEFWMDNDEFTDAPACTDAVNDDCGVGEWCQITDPDYIDVTNFIVTRDLSFEDVLVDDGAGTQTKAGVRKLSLHMEAELVRDSNISRELEDIIRVRNDIIILPTT